MKVSQDVLPFKPEESHKTHRGSEREDFTFGAKAHWTPPPPTTRENETLTNKDMPCLPDPQRPMEALTRSKGRSSVSEQRKPCCHERSEYLLQLYHQPSREREQWLHHSLRKFHSNSNSAPKQIGKNDKPKSPRKPGTLRKKIYSEHTATEIDNCSINR